MSRRKIADAADADAQLVAARAARVSNRTWAHQNVLCARSLHLWSVQRRRAATESGESGFVELVSAIPAAAPSPLRLRVGGVEIEVSAGFDTDTLARVLGVVRTR